MNCKKATYLLSRKEEGKLSRLEGWQLRFHVFICGMCKRFEKETAWLVDQTKKANRDAGHILSEDAKRRIESSLRALSKSQN